MGAPRFIWRSGACAPEESAWSHIQKFAYLNGFNGSDLAKIVAKVRGTSSPVTTANLSLFQPTPAAKTLLTVVLQQEEAPQDSFWLWPSTLKLVDGQAVASVLRFCPTCAAAGFHTALFQLESSLRCPIHGQALVDACQHCGRTIAYGIQGNALSNPYGCECGITLWAERDSMEWHGLSRASTAMLKEWRAWQETLQHASKPRLLGGMSHDMELMAITHHDNELYTDLALATAAPTVVQKILRCRRKKPLTVTLIHLGEKKHPSDSVSVKDGSSTATITVEIFRQRYEKFKAQLERQIEADHHSCITRARILPQWASVSLLRPWCEAITAVERWKDYWQKHLKIGWEDGCQLDYVARTVADSICRLPGHSVVKGITRSAIARLADVYLESTLVFAYSVSRNERLGPFNGATRAWPGVDQASWPCWSILESSSNHPPQLLVWHPELHTPWQQLFRAVRGHAKDVQEGLRMASDEIRGRLGFAVEN